MSPFSRREFLQRSAILSAAAATSAPLAAADTATKKVSANDRLRVAVVGVNGRGKDHVSGFAGKHNCEVAVICDCDEAVIGEAMKRAAKAQGTDPKYVRDIRKVLDDKSIDIVSVATPNHWHALAAVWAMRAGKDVYGEKPASHNVHEGRLMVQAARKYNRICQTGTQSRSMEGMREAIDYVQSGKIGKVNIAYATCFKPRGSIGHATAPTEPPKSLDYDLWTGPAHLQAVNRKRLHYDWHWIWEYGNGDIGNQGVHEMDKARWGLSVGLPTSVVSVGGRLSYVDDGETPNTQLSVFEYPSAHLIFEVRGLKTEKYKGAGVGNIFFGDKGYVVCPGNDEGIVYDPSGKQIVRFRAGGDHFGNFVKAVRSRKVSDQNCDVEEGHQSAALCHLANISYRLGAETTLDKPVEAFTDCKEAVEALDRMKKHLADNNVDLAKAVGRIGPKLAFDPKAETFAGNKAANDLLFAEYRKGFDISEAL
jgi:predicted dehydrogenase